MSDRATTARRRYAVCDPYSRYYDPDYCGDDEYYYGPPLFIDGFWFNNGGRYRDWHGATPILGPWRLARL